MGRKPRFFVRITRSRGSAMEINVEFRTPDAAKAFAVGLITEHPSKYTGYELYEM